MKRKEWSSPLERAQAMVDAGIAVDIATALVIAESEVVADAERKRVDHVGDDEG